MFLLVIFALLIHWLFLMHCTIWYIKNKMHCIEKLIYEDILHNYDYKNIKKMFWDVIESLSMLMHASNPLALLNRNPWY